MVEETRSSLSKDGFFPFFYTIICVLQMLQMLQMLIICQESIGESGLVDQSTN